MDTDPCGPTFVRVFIVSHDKLYTRGCNSIFNPCND